MLLQTARQRLGELGESALFGAFDSSRLVGTVGVKRHEGLKERHKAFIWGMYVSEARRGRGFGSLLLREAIDRARSWDGLEQVHLTVSEVAIEARRMYERQGFKAWGREPRALVWEGRAADEHHMVLMLRDSLAE
jgi:GNAT superfamily N-acetyltransferase